MKIRYLLTVLVLGFFAQASMAQNTDDIRSDIDPSRLDAVRLWIRNTRQDLERSKKEVATLPFFDQADAIRDGMARVMAASGSNQAEFLTRDIIYRALEVQDLLKTLPPSPKRYSFNRYFMTLSLTWAQGLAPRDIYYLSQPRPVSILATRDRLLLGLDWAEYMVNTSFALPTNASHAQFLIKVMGFLYNDILSDDKYNRALAGIANQFMLEHEKMKKVADHFETVKNQVSPTEALEVVKRLREFLTRELEIARNAVGKYYLLAEEGVVNDYPYILPVVIPTQVTLWERVEQPCKADKNRPFSVAEYRKLEELRRAGSFDALGFQYIWDKSCDFAGGLKVGQATEAEAADLSVIAELLNLTCIAKPAGGIVKIDEALRVAAQIKSGKANFEAIQMEFQGSCKLKE